MPSSHGMGRKKRGLAPGTLLHVGTRKTERIKITVTDYTSDSIKMEETSDVDTLCRTALADTTTWINIDGVDQVEDIAAIGKQLGLDDLVLEDIVNTAHRPKIEEHSNYIFIILKMLHLDSETLRITPEQVSLILMNNCLITFQEYEGDVFGPVRERLKKVGSRMRRSGPDYLAHALMDTIVDNYFVVLEHLSEQIEEIEDTILEGAEGKTMQELYGLRREMILLRRLSWPMREMITSLSRSDSPLIRDETDKFIRDLHDHVIQVMESVESSREALTSLHEVYLSIISNKMNEVMKVLTIIATIFIPLTFVAGIYGMNFELMPELKWPWGYPFALGIMGLVAFGMFIYFRIKKWL